MAKPKVNTKSQVSITEFDAIYERLTMSDALRAEKMFNVFMCGKEPGRLTTAWGYASIFIAGYISGIRRERAKRREA